MKKIYLFDWGDTIMKDFPDETGPMCTWKRVAIIPNADKMLQYLSLKADCYMATNAKDSTKEDIIKALSRVHIDNYFKGIFCFKELGVMKPSSEYFDIVIEKLKVKKTEICMVGDNLEKDIEGAISYGIDAILYDPEDKYPNYNGLKINDLLMLVE